MVSKSLIATTAAALLAAPLAAATSCVQFDTDFNLYAFGVNGQNFKVGTQDTWAQSGQVTPMTATGAPPFDGANTQCFLAQFFNAIYVIDGDKANPSDVHIFNAQTQTWSTQKTTPPSGVDVSTGTAILDHDTNVFFSLVGKSLYKLDLEAQTSANATTLVWDTVQDVIFPTDNYKPSMAIAQNHIHFLGVPGTQPGQAYIFVIHFSFNQPDPQSYPASSGSTFPVTHGAVASFFDKTPAQVQQQFAFIPDDGSATYIVNVEKNSTVAAAGPTVKSAGSTYATNPTSLVQLTSDGQIYFLPVPAAGAPLAGAAWAQAGKTLQGAGSSGASGASSASAAPSTFTSVITSGGATSTVTGVTTPSTSAKPNSASTLARSGLVALSLGSLAFVFLL